MSGGQQALATLALSFALQAAFPSPFYFFDEIDSALDTSNASRVADYISSQKGAQYLVVSHKPQVTLSIPRTCAVYVHAQFEPCWGDRSGGLPEMGHCMQVSIRLYIFYAFIIECVLHQLHDWVDLHLMQHDLDFFVMLSLLTVMHDY